MTIEKFQQLSKIYGREIDELDKSIQLVQCMTGKTHDEIDAMPVHKFNKLCNRIVQLFENQYKQVNKDKPKNIIRANGSWYQLNYDITTAGKYVEATTFSGDIIGNLHMILATMATPLRLTPIGFKPFERDHELISYDMLQADFKHAYHAAVFFYAVYKLSTIGLVPYFQAGGMTMKKSLELQRNLTAPLDGFTMPEWLQNLKIAP